MKTYVVLMCFLLFGCTYQPVDVVNSGLHNIDPNAKCKWNGPLPDQKCSPGEAFPLQTIQVNGIAQADPPSVIVGDICEKGYSKNIRSVSEKTKKLVYAEYGVLSRSTGEYEVDHIIPLELGGTNDIENLYPQPAEPRPGFHEKDVVENCLHRLVCKGTMKLVDAQQLIAQNWTKGLDVCGVVS